MWIVKLGNNNNNSRSRRNIIIKTRRLHIDNVNIYKSGASDINTVSHVWLYQ